MEIAYYPETDTLYIELAEWVAVSKTIECAPDLAIDVSQSGTPVGVEIEHASEHVDLSALVDLKALDTGGLRNVEEVRLFIARSGKVYDLIDE